MNALVCLPNIERTQGPQTPNLIFNMVFLTVLLLEFCILLERGGGVGPSKSLYETASLYINDSKVLFYIEFICTI